MPSPGDTPPDVTVTVPTLPSPLSIPPVTLIGAAWLPRTVKVVRISEGKVDAAALLGLNVGTEVDIENRKTHHDDELDHDRRQLFQPDVL
jgi:hypothetical protein